VADDATHSSANAGAREAPAQNVAGNAAYHGTCGSTFFLLRHSSATSESQQGHQRCRS